MPPPPPLLLVLEVVVVVVVQQQQQEEEEGEEQALVAADLDPEVGRARAVEARREGGNGGGGGGGGGSEDLGKRSGWVGGLGGERSVDWARWPRGQSSRVRNSKACLVGISISFSL